MKKAWNLGIIMKYMQAINKRLSKHIKIGWTKETKSSQALNKCNQLQETSKYYTALKNVYQRWFCKENF